MRVTQRYLIKEFIDNRKASVLPLFGFMVIFLIVTFGAAVDFSRAVSAREKLSYAIDAAALSVAADLSTTVMSDAEIHQALSKSFEANLADDEFKSEAIKNITFKVDADNGTITVNSTASLETYFIGLGGIGGELGSKFDVLGVSTGSTVAYSRYDVELALALDVTGSMWSDMGTLRSASKALVDILIPVGTKPEDSKVRIALVPYSQGVNLGSYASMVKGGAHGYADSSKCVTERQNYNDGSNQYNVKYTDTAYNYYTATNPPPKDTFYGGGTSNCSNDSEMIPLSNNRNVLTSAITDLEANGGTAGQTGVTWAWNSLSPNYSNVWPTASAPAAYTNKEVLKFAIIMTDGDNNRHYSYTPGKTEEVCYNKKGKKKKKKKKNAHKLTCVDETTPGTWKENSESESYSNVSSTTSRDTCAAMKAAGIELFGVYFGTNSNSAGSKNMQACASPGNYYKATSSAALISAFGNIAKKIQQIYISG